MFAKRLREELGYSLVEVMVAIMILALAIIPMVSMFDAGLQAASSGADYDRGRALANQQMAGVRALTYTQAVAKYPPGTTPGCSTGEEPRFSCVIKTTYVNDQLQSVSNATTAMQVEITITWDGGNKQYSTIGLKAKGQPD